MIALVKASSVVPGHSDHSAYPAAILFKSISTMATATQPAIARTPTLADILPFDVPLDRILFRPTPGTATVADLLAIHDREDRLCELVDGTLVEKTMGVKESNLAALLIYLLYSFIFPRKLGMVLGADGMIQLRADQVRIPDVAFFRSEQLINGNLPEEAISSVIPDLAVEILSPSNTKNEMDRKLREYFAAGVRLVWYADHRKRLVWVYEAVDQVTILDQTGTLDGGTVLPGFTLRVADWLK